MVQSKTPESVACMAAFLLTTSKTPTATPRKNKIGAGERFLPIESVASLSKELPSPGTLAKNESFSRIIRPNQVIIGQNVAIST